MEFKEAKNKFVQTWGALGSQWGINKTMAQIHALLMVSHEPVSMEDIMEELQISRGNASMNLRALMDWGIVYKEYKAGERREFFTAEKDLDELAVKISRERSKREIKPALKVLKEVSDEMLNWKTAGTKLYQQLPADCFESLKEVEPLRELPRSRPRQEDFYKTLREIKNKK